MTIFTSIFQKYALTQKLRVWVLALLYMSPVSLLAAGQSVNNVSDFNAKTVKDAFAKNGDKRNKMIEFLKKNSNKAISLANELYKASAFETLYFLICLEKIVKAKDVKVEKFDMKTVKEVLQGHGDKKNVMIELLKSHQAEAISLSGELYQASAFETLYFLICLEKIVKAKDVEVEKFDMKTVKEVLQGHGDKKVVMTKLLESHQAEAISLANELYKASAFETLYFLIHLKEIVKAEDVEVEKFDMKTVKEVLQGHGDKKVVMTKLLESHQAEAISLANELYKASAFETLYFLIHLKEIVKAEDVKVEKFDMKTVKEVLQGHGDKKVVMTKLLESHQAEAKALVQNILGDDNALKDNIELLKWLTIPSNTNNQGGIVPSGRINITAERAFKIYKDIANQQKYESTCKGLLDIMKSIMKAKSEVAKQVLQKAIEGKKGDSWPSKNVNFRLLYLLMIHSNGPELTMKKEDVGILDFSAVKEELSNVNSCETMLVINKIFSENGKINNYLHWEIFPSKPPLMRDTSFDYKNVDWDNTKWGYIKYIRDYIKPIKIPAEIVVKKLKEDSFDRKEILKDIVLDENNNLLESVLKKVDEKIKVKNKTIEWNKRLSEADWDIVTLFVKNKIIEPKDVVEEVLPGIKSKDRLFKNYYNLAGVDWNKFDEKVFPKLAKSGIATFSTKNYQTIAKKVFPGLEFINGEVQVSNIDWKGIKSYEIANYLLEKGIIPKKILVNMPRSIQERLASNAVPKSAEEAFLEKVKKQKLMYYGTISVCVGMLLVGCATVFYIFGKKEKKKGSQAKRYQDRRKIKKSGRK